MREPGSSPLACPPSLLAALASTRLTLSTRVDSSQLCQSRLMQAEMSNKRSIQIHDDLSSCNGLVCGHASVSRRDLYIRDMTGPSTDLCADMPEKVDGLIHKRHGSDSRYRATDSCLLHVNACVLNLRNCLIKNTSETETYVYKDQKVKDLK